MKTQNLRPIDMPIQTDPDVGGRTVAQTSGGEAAHP
jgi:hypothetical protein